MEAVGKAVTGILDKRDPLVDSRAAEALAGLGLRERGDRVPGHVLIFGVIGPCPDASRPRDLEDLRKVVETIRVFNGA